MRWYSHAVYVFGAVFVLIGIALLILTVAKGGGVVGLVLGGLFLALGVARIQFERARQRSGR